MYNRSQQGARGSNVHLCLLKFSCRSKVQCLDRESRHLGFRSAWSLVYVPLKDKCILEGQAQKGFQTQDPFVSLLCLHTVVFG